MDEGELVKECQSGNAKAFEPLFRMHLQMAVRTAFLIVGDWPTAEDAAQEAFVRAFSRIRSFRVGEPFGPWLYRIVVNEARRLAAKVSRRPIPSELPADLIQAMGSTPEETAVQQESQTALWSAIQGLSAEHRTVIVLKYFNRFSELEIAAVLGLPQSTVKSRLYVARQRLAVRLDPGKEVLA